MSQYQGCGVAQRASFVFRDVSVKQEDHKSKEFPSELKPLKKDVPETSIDYLLNCLLAPV